MKTSRRYMLFVVVLLVALAVLVAVDHARATNNASTVEENKNVVRRWMNEAMNQGNTDAIDALVAPDFVGHNSSDFGNIYGREGVREMVNSTRSMLNAYHVSELALVAEDDMVSCLTVTRGRFIQAWNGLLPNGAEVNYLGNTLFRLENGQIVEIWSVHDTLGLMQQLTAPPVDPSMYP